MAINLWLSLAAMSAALTMSGCTSDGPALKDPIPPEQLQERVAETLDAFHLAASKADGKTYFNLLADDAVFLGTDASERWTKEEFEAYAMPYFSQGKGWTYSVLNRHISISPSGGVAWFDEKLTNEKYGECRGSGALVQAPSGRWLITQYNLTVPIPNDLLPGVAEQIRQHLMQPPK
jgi:ketosteroid isomerase-like protein